MYWDRHRLQHSIKVPWVSVIMYDQGNAAKRAHTYKEYRGCLIEAVPSVQNGPTDVLLRTGYGPVLLRQILKSFANYVMWIVAKKSATMMEITVTRHTPDFASESRRFDHSTSSLRISQPLCRLGHVKWRNCASGILFDVHRPISSIGRASVNSTGDSLDARGAENREAEWVLGIGNAARHPEGRYRELLTAIVTF